MKRLAYVTLLILSVGLFLTCQEFEIKPATKVETGTATPLATSITVNAKIIELSGEGNTDHGFCYATHDNPTVNDGKLSKGIPKVGDFTGEIDGLAVNTRYYIRAYCNSQQGVVYGKSVSVKTLDGQPTITTAEITDITSTSAVSGGSITSDGGAPITARGVVWSTSQNPTIETNLGVTSNGTGIGTFTSSLTSLQPGTVYYVRAYATNSVGTVYGNQQTFTTHDGLPVLTTAAVTSITATTATSGGNITSDGGFDITARGVVWSASENPTTTSNLGVTSDGAGTGSYTSSLTNLQPGTVYYVRAYATNSVGTAYGNQLSFTTQDGVIALTTTEVTSITPTSAVSGGSITSDGGAPITARGIVWSTTENPTTSSNLGMTTDGTGTGNFSSNLTNLQPGTVYYVRAYATNSVGTIYGNQQTFTTQYDLPELNTTAVGSITATTATSGGNITSDGGSTITARGVVWSTSENPTTISNLGMTTDGTGTGNFSSNLSNLQPGMVYYVRAYATNSVGTAYGNQLSFTTQDGAITLSTNAVTSIAATSAVSGGSITSDGGAPINARGVVWSTSQNPTTSSNLGMTTDGTGTGSFTSNLVNLQPATVYYIRAYATNSVGTVYGNQQTFTTQCDLPKLSTTAVGSITATTATSGGNITSDGGAPITARGVVWSTTENPTTSNNLGIATNGTGTGSFTSNLTNLQPGTVYYVRAYATNSVGTAYGNQLSFTTQDGAITLSTNAVTSITATSAASGGSITSDGGAPINARGVVWSTFENPTLESNSGMTTDGVGTGNFSSNLTNLQPGTVYYVRAYATNSVGTAYGNQQTFTTHDGLPVLTTAAVTSITPTTAACGGNITSDGGFAITARGVVWSTSENPTTSSNLGMTNDGTGMGNFSSNLTNLQPGTVYYVRAYTTNSYGTQYGNQVSFTTPVDGPGGTITDADGNTYNTIWINGRQWMKENLKTTRYNDGTAIPLVTDKTAWAALSTPAYCWYNNDQTTYGNTYGALYNWYTVNTGNLCPTGWHVPTDAEWTTLLDYVGGDSIAGTKLKATSGWYVNYGMGNGTDNFGFSALPGGVRTGGYFSSEGLDGHWWTSTEEDVSNALGWKMIWDLERVLSSTAYKEMGFSVRCIKD
ncbi:FISUMP domain-containing protein [Tenuifilum osseticum]|uniref:FISUMP domain-containing protein n=1 Tax=Tenuifilum osseticum TaxID=3374723 RepID=UPI0034E5FAD0